PAEGRRPAARRPAGQRDSGELEAAAGLRPGSGPRLTNSPRRSRRFTKAASLFVDLRESTFMTFVVNKTFHAAERSAQGSSSRSDRGIQAEARDRNDRGFHRQ